MKMFRSAEEKKRDATRSDLEAAQRKLASVLARENIAATSSDRWAIWTTERDAAAADVARLTALVGHLEATAETAKRDAEAAAFLKKVEACRTLNAQAKERVRNEGSRLVIALMTLARDVAAATMEAALLNTQLPPGMAPIEVGDFSARDIPRLEREVIETKTESLWVNADNGNLIGSQDIVVDNKNGTGFVKISPSLKVNCAKRSFLATKYHPVHVYDHPGHFFSLLRLPFPDRPGAIFDGAHAVLNDVASMSVELQPMPKSSRLVQIELKPLDEWVPARSEPAETDL